MIRVLGLDHLEFGVPNVDDVTGFYVERWGLQCFDEPSDRRTRFLRTQTSGHHALAVHPSEELCLDHLAFEVADRSDLDQAVIDAEAAGFVVQQGPADANEPGYRMSASLGDPDGNAVELIWAPDKVTDQYQPPHIAPRKVGHVVLNSPQPEAMERFYRQLGFRVSDRTARGMSFLRCNSDHHTLALNKSAGSGVQHVAYDVVDLDSVMRGLAWLTGNDLSCIWGPGRHGPGNNIFTYYKDPAGLIVEYYAELQQIQQPEDDIDERYWGPEWSGDLWGLAGPPPSEFRR